MATRPEPIAPATPPRRLLALRGRDDVAGTLRSPSSWFWGSPAIELGAAFGSEQQRGAIARRMSYWLGVCGCQLAAFLALAALVCCGVAAYSHGGGLWSLAQALGAAIAAAVAAKLLSVMLSRGLFVLELLRLLAVAPSPAPETRR
jgi:hypothetical protein